MAKKMRKKKGRETTKKDAIHSTGQETRGRRTSKESQDSVKILVAPEAKILSKYSSSSFVFKMSTDRRGSFLTFITRYRERAE